jgi:hypothetical protein
VQDILGLQELEEVLAFSATEDFDNNDDNRRVQI